MRFFSILFVCIFFFIGLNSCQDNKWKVDLSQNPTELSLYRFELILFQLAQDDLKLTDWNKIVTKYPQFSNLYSSNIMRFGSTDAQQTITNLNGFIQNKNINSIFKEVQNTFPTGSLDQKLKELEQGFKYFNHYFPKRIIPEIYTMVTAFAYNVVCDDSLIAIGLDTYLGGDYKIYPQTGIPKYKFEKFDQKYIVSDALKAWLFTDFENTKSQNLLDQMIFNGKILYLLKAFLPEKELQLLLNYNKEELLWCNENEAEIWFHFVDMELLYTIENHQITKYMGDAPFIAGFPKGSPGRVGQWMGYKIVNAFMENNNISLSELMEVENSNKILQQSKYKPRR